MCSAMQAAKSLTRSSQDVHSRIFIDLSPLVLRPLGRSILVSIRWMNHSIHSSRSSSPRSSALLHNMSS